MSQIEYAMLFAAMCFVGGMWLGGALMARKWTENADRIQRIEYGGKLYKVTHD